MISDSSVVSFRRCSGTVPGGHRAAMVDLQCLRRRQVWLQCSGTHTLQIFRGVSAGHFIFMVALRNRADHYIFILWFLSSSIFFPRLISAVGDWMSTILPHMVWP